MTQTGIARPFPIAGRGPDIPGLVFRHMAGRADFSGMNDAANESRVADGAGFVTSLDAFTNFYDHLTNYDPERDVVIVEVEGQIVAYGRSAWHSDGDTRILEVNMLSRPEWRGKGIEETLLLTLEARLREIDAALAPVGERHFQAGSEPRARYMDDLLERHGYAPTRYFYEMVRPNLDDQRDCPLPAGLEIREVRPEHLRSIWEAANEAFRDEWDYREESDEDFERFRNDPIESGDPSLWRIAWDGDQVAGQVRSFINHDENARLGRKRGWVENISVRRPWRKRGLARALIAASFPLLRARGMTEAALGVDTNNPSGALRVYESVGFRPVSRSTVYRKPLR
jgi:ribosomal protein S18 acetylase RimI-like enzyme